MLSRLRDLPDYQHGGKRHAEMEKAVEEAAGWWRWGFSGILWYMLFSKKKLGMTVIITINHSK